MYNGQFITFIIGAGASADYELPIGSGLNTDIIQLLKTNDKNFLRFLGEDPSTRGLMHYTPAIKLPPLFPEKKQSQNINDLVGYPIYNHARNYLINALEHARSIDYLCYQLENDPHAFDDNSAAKILNVQLLAKACIAWIICNKSTTVLRNLSNHTNKWHNVLFKMLDTTTNAETLKKLISRIKIITFNYETIFGNLFYEHIIRKKPNEQLIKEIFSQLEIVHVHGQVQDYRFQSLPDCPLIDQENEEYLKLSGQSYLNKQAFIRFSHESLPKQNERIDYIIKNSSLLFFLGFGYLEENLKLITPSQRLKRVCPIYGTGYDLSPQDREKIKNNIRRNFFEPFTAQSEFIFIEDVKIDKLISSNTHSIKDLLSN